MTYSGPDKWFMMYAWHTRQTTKISDGNGYIYVVDKEKDHQSLILKHPTHQRVKFISENSYLFEF